MSHLGGAHEPPSARSLGTSAEWPTHRGLLPLPSTAIPHPQPCVGHAQAPSGVKCYNGTYGIGLGIYSMCACHIKVTLRCVLMRELAFHAHTRYTHMPPPPSPLGWHTYMYMEVFYFALFSFFIIAHKSLIVLCTICLQRGSSRTTVSPPVCAACPIAITVSHQVILCGWARPVSPRGPLHASSHAGNHLSAHN